ncbi:MAG TPA: PTS sugar transporter subunit IIA [Candidatus Anaerostipes avistercoris]|uniref:PTS sugar transporter subunit IIA n=1 Tax=Candidatus Anaerostipes avistercoris TaxID=2838462 RepID=A0A9D2PIU8_9FIRM|nr:PTS sugar transporter subunit IIA [uncultured Anaerostipes sp.]HJC50423.1 PTS sugar transporter subunit IIA [Candidatus Anaerostipes avistercoris]
MGTKYLVIQGTADNNEEAIKLCGDALYKAGIVNEDFGKLCVEREKDYPTGLPTQIPTAIPHAKATGIKQNAICLLKLEHPVVFRRLDDDMEEVKTDMVFNLAIKDPNEHLSVLQKMMDFLNNPEVLLKCKELSNEETIAYLTEQLG